MVTTGELKTKRRENEDYAQFLGRYGLTDPDLWALMERLPQPQPHPLVEHAFCLAPSPIHGTGVFARCEVLPGSQLPACIGTQRTILARYTNHSATPNARLRYVAGDAWVEVLTALKPGDELTMDYADNLEQLRAQMGNGS